MDLASFKPLPQDDQLLLSVNKQDALLYTSPIENVREVVANS